MKKILILGAGTAGTMMANHLQHELDKKLWEIEIIDEKVEHHYQPGYLFLPFDIYGPEDIIKTIEEFIPKGVSLRKGKIDKIDPMANQVKMVDGTSIAYDVLIIATGAKIAPEETEGMRGSEWQKSVFDFYTFEGALALRNKLREWDGGNMVFILPKCRLNVRWLRLSSRFLPTHFSRIKKCARK